MKTRFCMKRDIGPCAVGIDRNPREGLAHDKKDIGPCAVGIDRNSFAFRSSAALI